MLYFAMVLLLALKPPTFASVRIAPPSSVLLFFLSSQFLSFQLSALLRLCVSVCVCGQFDNSLIAFSVPASRLLFQGLIHRVLFQMTLCASGHTSGSAPCVHLSRSVPAPPGCKFVRRICSEGESCSLQAGPKDWAPCRRLPPVCVCGRH